MVCDGLDIRPENQADHKEIIELYDRVFGPGRFVRAANLLRTDPDCYDKRLCYVATSGKDIAGSIRYSSVKIGQVPAALLGPLAIAPEHEGKKCGLHLMSMTLESALMRGYRLVLLVGDYAYYKKVGFQPVPVGQIYLPSPYNPARLLVKEIVAGTLENTQGQITLGPAGVRQK